jgi:ADP-ribose pyrophosphatase YjhB (NUDIX family)
MIVCATIVRNNEILLVKHSCEQKPGFGYWLLPAGRQERGEGLEEALKREIKEELSLEVEIVRKLTEHIDPYTGDNLVNFLCIPLTSEIETSIELAEAKWFNLDEIQKTEEINPNLKQFLTELLRC